MNKSKKIEATLLRRDGFSKKIIIDDIRTIISIPIVSNLSIGVNPDYYDMSMPPSPIFSKIDFYMDKMTFKELKTKFVITYREM